MTVLCSKHAWLSNNDNTCMIPTTKRQQVYHIET